MANKQRDPTDVQVGANLKRIIQDLGYPTVQVSQEPLKGMSLDSLYKRCNGDNSLKVRDIPMLAEAWNCDPEWLARELVKFASDRDMAIEAIAESLGVERDEVEARLKQHATNHKMDWRQAYRLFRSGQITL